MEKSSFQGGSKALEANDYFLLLCVCYETKEVLVQLTPDTQDATGSELSSGSGDALQISDLPAIMSDRLSGSWKMAAKEMVDDVFSESKDAGRSLMDHVQLIRISRFWYPTTGSASSTDSTFLQRFLLFLPIDSEEKTRIKVKLMFFLLHLKHFVLLQEEKNLSWTEMQSLLTNGTFDPEMSEAVKKIFNEPSLAPSFIFREYNKDSFLTDTNLETPQETKRIQTILTKSAGAQIEDQKRLYRQFLHLTFL